MPVISSSLSSCDECGTQTNVISTHTQEDAAKVRRHKCPSCGNAQFSVEVPVDKKHIYCLKKYQVREPLLMRLVQALYA